MLNILYKKSFLLAILIHIILIIGLGFNFLLLEKAKPVKDIAGSKMIQAFVYHNLQQTKTPVSHKVAVPTQLKNLQDVRDFKTNKATPSEYLQNRLEATAEGVATKQPVDKLLQILHDTIQQHQHYPKQAKIMQRRGTVLVKFILFPDGHIENIALVKSSQTISLDEAAVLAITEAAPIKEAALYLQDKKNFIVHVDFQ